MTDRLTNSMEGRLRSLADEICAIYPYYKPYAGLAFDRLPVTDKRTMAARRAEFEHPNPGKLYESFTSGSTGVPFRCVKTAEERWKLSLALYKRRKRWGLPAKHRMLLLSNRLLAEPKSLARCAERMAQERPHFVQGRASALHALAEFLHERGIAAPDSLLFAQNWGEYLHPRQRRAVEEAFGVPFVDYYGLEEIWGVAYSTGEGKLEVDEDSVYAEAVDPKTALPVPDGEYGEIAVTSFVMRSLPFVRYRTGDIGCLRSDPDTGKRLLQLLPVRASQIRLPGGAIHAATLRYLDKFFWELSAERGVRQFQIVQLAYSEFKLLLATETDPRDFEALRDKLGTFLGQSIGAPAALLVETVPFIEPDPDSGKAHSFVCRMEPKEGMG